MAEIERMSDLLIGVLDRIDEEIETLRKSAAICISWKSMWSSCWTRWPQCSAVWIGHIPCFIGDARPDLVRLAPPNPEFSADLWLLTHPDLRHSPRVRVFLDFLAAEIAQQRKLIEGLIPFGSRHS